VMMLELSGIEIAIRLQRKHLGCRVLLFSGQAATTDLLAVARTGGHKFEILTKPVHPNDLLAGIRRLTEPGSGMA
jgi:DNA-binding response OmpR family regulator